MTPESQNSDSSHTELPPEFEVLVEKLAERQHNVWMEEKIKDNYKPGAEYREPVYNNGKLIKHGSHPDLIPYNKLSEEKKNYDRANASGIIKAILEMGYKIIKKGEQN